VPGEHMTQLEELMPWPYSAEQEAFGLHALSCPLLP
jgi:hypothetical protein